MAAWAGLGVTLPSDVPAAQQNALAFVTAYDVAFDIPTILTDPLTAMAALDQDLETDEALCTNPTGCGNGNGTTVFRLREGIERYLITDINNPAATAKAQSEVHIMWDRVATAIASYNHVPGGSNVLYMDGHVKFIKYPGEAPVNRVTANFAGALLGG